jgi:Plasma-membrane choline transporter
MFSRINLAINIIKATADFITDYKRIIMVPAILFLSVMIYLLFWVSASAHVFATGHTEYDPSLPFGRMRWTTSTRLMNYYQLFALLWNIAFLTALSYFAITTASCLWYFSANKKEIANESPLMKGFTWGLLYHMGTLAIGSFLIALLWLV